MRVDTYRITRQEPPHRQARARPQHGSGATRWRGSSPSERGRDRSTRRAADGLNWPALAQCESGGNPRLVPTAPYHGLYQFTLSTWQSVGGSGDPIDASPNEQTYRAQLLYRRSGDSPWPVCGHYLYT